MIKDLSAISEIDYLKKYDSQLLFTILKVYDGLKPAVEFTVDKNNKEKLVILKSLFKKIGLRFASYPLSSFSSIYCLATYNPWLLFKWLILFKLDDETILGYPRCCVSFFKVRDKAGGSIITNDIYYYYILSAFSVTDISEFLKRVIYLDYVPCSIRCKKTKHLAEGYSLLIDKYSTILPKYFKKVLYMSEVNFLINWIQDVMRDVENRVFIQKFGSEHNLLSLLKKHGLDNMMSLGKDFECIIKDLFITDKKEIIRIRNKMLRKISLLKKSF